MIKDKIIIKGAREHNLKNIDIEIPRDKFVVITGLSGSGKSSLAFDTIYAEGQRRYVESLSAYARQFLGQMEKPDVDYIEGLSPAISIDQKTTSKNPRSTVGTVTEIYDYLRLMYARVGTPHCPECGKVISQQTIDQMVDFIMGLQEEKKLMILAPIVQGRKGEHIKLIEDVRKNGFARIRIDGIMTSSDEEIKLEKNKKHNIDVVIDRIKVKAGIEKRVADSLETALKLTGGIVLIDIEGEKETVFSQNFACVDCGIGIEDPAPRMFSFNTPYGKCPTCDGLGEIREMDPELVIPNKEISVMEGAIDPWKSLGEESWYYNILDAAAKHYGFSLSVPIKDLKKEHLDILLYGNGGEKIKVKYEREFGRGEAMMAVEGVIRNLERRYKETKSDYMRFEIEKYMSSVICNSCNGARLKKESLAFTVGGINIAEFCNMSVRKAKEFVEGLELTDREKLISKLIVKEIKERLSFLVNVGLEYLTLSRSAGTLSGGEAQRIRLATQIGSSLMGVLYVLDEPSIGLHQKDNDKLLLALRKLTDIGNTLLIVEHDEDTMRHADHIIDIGPGAGVHGGYVVAQGTLEDIMATEGSITGQYLSGKRWIPVPEKRRTSNGKSILIKGAREHNLKNIDVNIPLGVFTCVTGVSGSGKSTLVNRILFKDLAHKLYGSKVKPGDHDTIKGVVNVDKVIDIDQSPIGRTPRSNPATYSGVFDYIRELFAQTNDAKMRGYKNGRFSFNTKGGRCEACKGDGIIKIEMQFLPDVYVPCEICKGKRYSRETLEVRFKGKNIADVLDMTVEDALEFFDSIPKIQRKMQTLSDVGLGYVKLGQPSTELSGGEAQRIKLAFELSKRSTGKTIYILDEPTTGLHAADVHKLLGILDRLVDAGNTVLVIEHNIDVIKRADHIIDLGPDGGDKGGYIVAEGTPEHVATVKESYTGQYLLKTLSDNRN